MRAILLRALTAAAAASLLLGGCSTTPGRSDDLEGVVEAPTDSLAADYVGMGVEYLKRGQPAIALQRLQRARELDPDYPPVYNVLAILYEQLGETEQARQSFEHGIKLAPKDPYIRNAYGTFLCKQKQYPAADEQFQLATQTPLYETPWIAVTNAGICARLSGDQAKAEGYFRQALTMNAQFGPALYQLAEISHGRGDNASAKSYVERSLRIAQPTPELLALAAQVERQLGNKAQAKRYESALKERFPDSPELQKLR